MTHVSRCLVLISCAALLACGKKNEQKEEVAAPAPAVKPAAAAEPLIPPMDKDNIVSIALASKDHTTLVAAAKSAGYVTGLANPGPLTVFAPTNAAFDKLPAGTVETLLKPENQSKLQDILKYHVITSAHDIKSFKDGDVIGMVNGDKATIHIKPDGSATINDANIVGSVKASNGMVHVIDTVLLPPE